MIDPFRSPPAIKRAPPSIASLIPCLNPFSFSGTNERTNVSAFVRRIARNQFGRTSNKLQRNVWKMVFYPSDALHADRRIDPQIQRRHARCGERRRRGRAQSPWMMSAALPPVPEHALSTGVSFEFPAHFRRPGETDKLDPVFLLCEPSGVRVETRKHCQGLLGPACLQDHLPESKSGERSLWRGFEINGQPAAMAGAALCATRLSGKLKGVMASTGPTGNR